MEIRNRRENAMREAPLVRASRIGVNRYQLIAAMRSSAAWNLGSSRTATKSLSFRLIEKCRENQMVSMLKIFPLIPCRKYGAGLMAHGVAWPSNPAGYDPPDDNRGWNNRS
ncbi:MAG: hypothetical protein ABIR47_10195 [Candidatus Kapaibacterium sp.]